MQAAQLALGVVGVLAGAYGMVRLAGLGWGNLLAALPWLAGGVLVHDALLVPLTLVLGAVAARHVPQAARAPLAAAYAVLAAVSLVAVPALGRFGARPDNDTLLDRPYAAGWSAAAVLVMGAAGLTAGVRLLRGRRSGSSTQSAHR